jgi:RimJ/RimL family protein N-acetyltransferase
MKLLIDTNIFIPLEPTSPEDVSEHTAQAARLAQLTSQSGSQLWLHPAQRIDIAQDLTEDRRRVRQQLFQKYPVLEISLPLAPMERTNDWVDDQLVVALERNAVTALVTEDRRLTHRAIEKLGSERVLTLADAIALMSTLVESEVQPPPAVEAVRAYDLDLSDRFWDSFRSEYDGFDVWFRKCQEQHRTAWVIRDPDANRIIGASIVNHEKKDVRGRKTLKICSFKIDSEYSGRRYGELLLKSVFQYAFENRFDSFYVTAFPHHEQLLALLEDFGFEREVAEHSDGEVVLSKPLTLDFGPDLVGEPLAFFIRNGPFVFHSTHPVAYLVPILPTYHAMLFPEIQFQQPLVPGREAHGNCLRKAYLSSSAITELAPGSILFFYRSEDEQAVRAWGIVERTLRSADPDAVCGFVIPRTVYRPEEITEMSRRGPILAIMFRQCLRRIEVPVKLSEMITQGVIAAAPQSLMQLGPDAKQWMIERCQKQS